MSKLTNSQIEDRKRYKAAALTGLKASDIGHHWTRTEILELSMKYAEDQLNEDIEFNKQNEL